MLELDHDVLYAGVARVADDGEAGDGRAALDARGEEEDRVALSAHPDGRGVEELRKGACLQMVGLETLQCPTDYV